MIAAAVVLAASAVAVGLPTPEQMSRRRLGLAQRPPWRPSRRDMHRAARLAAVPAAVLAALAVVLLGSGAQVLVGLAVLVAVGVAVRMAAVSRGRRRSRATARTAVEAVSLLAAELQAGARPEAALAATAAEFEVLAAPARAATRAADPAAALREIGDEAGGRLWHEVASAWWVAERAGAPLAQALARVAGRGRDDLDLATEIDAELAPSRATVRLMAVLPAFGLALGSGLGGDPLHVLLATVPGAACLLLGVLLAGGGLLWIEAVAAGAER